MRQILHVDMDAFFASVEQLDDPALRGKPVLVGGQSRRGVVAAASYEARKFGARSAMPMHEALRLCPKAIVVPGRRGRYEEVSASVFAIFRRYTPLVEGLSVDEAFLDVTESRSLFGDGAAIARAIKDAIRGELSLTASAGVAACKFAAKVASDMKKPDGLVVVPEDVAAFLAPLPIERMWGVGPKTAPVLRSLGLRTLGDLARAPLPLLERTLGAWGAEVQRLARGDDPRAVDPDGEAKSIGAESTYEEDLHDRASIERTLLAHATRVAERLTAEGLAGRTVTVKLKYADFTSVSRRTTLPEPVSDTQSIHEACRAALDRFELGRQGVRLTGVSVSGLGEAGAGQRALFADPTKQRRERLEQAIHGLRGRFGGGAVTRATLLEDDDVVAPHDERVPTHPRRP
jgi:DNA polymerase-4